MLKVLKFGGSSMADTHQFAKVKAIVDSDPSRRVVVVSAAGKRSRDDHKLTDLLYLCYAHLQYGVSCDAVFDMIRSRYLSIRDELHLSTPLEAEFAALWEKMDRGISQDELVSRGEYFAARLMADYLGYDFLDSTCWLRFRLDGTVDQPASYEALRRTASGRRVVVEEFLEGPEISVLSFTDGETVAPMVSSMDHKRALDGDQGLNTGGMGTIAPNPFYTEDVARRCMEEIFLPTIRAMAREGRPFKGCLYFGLMLTQDGPKVIEYNCRFGDPETQVVLPLMESDLFTVMRAVTDGHLKDTPVRFAKDKSACCVMIASKGYPEKYEKGFPISLPVPAEGEHIYVSGAKRQGDTLVSSGGRVLGMTATAPTLAQAVERAYALAEKVSFENGYYRRDIGKRALKVEK